MAEQADLAELYLEKKYDLVQNSDDTCRHIIIARHIASRCAAM